MDISNDSLKMSLYNNYYRSGKNNINAIQAAKAWSRDAMRVIILPTDSLEDLENDWIAFNSMIKKHRRESDWKCIELFGATNQDMYERYKSEYLKADIPNYTDSYMESYIDTINDDYYRLNQVNYTTVEVEKARKWGAESNRAIILPTRTLPELEQLWDSYQAMILKHRRESDWMSMELFGITNLSHYEYLKNQFLRKDISADDKSKYGSVLEHATFVDRGAYIHELCHESPMYAISKILEMGMHNNSVLEDRLIANIVDDAINELDKQSTVTINNTTPGDMPYFTPNDMEDMGIFSINPDNNFYGAISDNEYIGDTTVEEWFDMYKNTMGGFYTEFYKMTSTWVNTVRTLMEGLKRIEQSGDDYAINARKQAILELGWNPNIEFTDRSRKIARECASHIMNKNIRSKVIDLREFRTVKNEKTSVNEAISVSDLSPLYILISPSKIGYRASVSFNTELSNVYTFDSDKNRIVRTPMDKSDSKNKFDMFAVFFDKKDYDKVLKAVQSSVDKNFKYTFNLYKDGDERVACAKFINSLCMIAGIETTAKKTNPISDDTNKIYRLYTGTMKDYSSNKVNITMNYLNRTASVIRESDNNPFTESMYINTIYRSLDNDFSFVTLESCINCVEKDYMKRFLESVLFKPLRSSPYKLSENTKTDLDLNDINSLIFDNFSLIV